MAFITSPAPFTMAIEGCYKENIYIFFLKETINLKSFGIVSFNSFTPEDVFKRLFILGLELGATELLKILQQVFFVIICCGTLWC